MSREIPYNDYDLLREVAQGNEAAFARLVDLHKDNIFTSALRITGSKAVAEDILQDVFLNLWLKRQKLPELENFRGYLYTIAQNAIFDALRSRAKLKGKNLVIDPGDPSLFHTDPENDFQQKEYEKVLYMAVNRLPPKQKETFVLIRQQGLKRREAAALLHVSSETAKFNLDEALRKIKIFCLAYMRWLVFPLLGIFFY